MQVAQLILVLMMFIILLLFQIMEMILFIYPVTERDLFSKKN